MVLEDSLKVDDIELVELEVAQDYVQELFARLQDDASAAEEKDDQEVQFNKEITHDDDAKDSFKQLAQTR